jgi:hypothetical protein
MDKGAGFATRSPQARRPNKGLGIITSPNLQGSAGSPCVRSERGGYHCPARQNRHISPGRTAGTCPISRAGRDLENERRNRKNARAWPRDIGIAGRDVKVDGPRRVVARPQSAGQCVSGTRKTDLHVAACQRHDRLPPKAAGPPPHGPMLPQPSLRLADSGCVSVVDCNQVVRESLRQVNKNVFTLVGISPLCVVTGFGLGVT